MPDKLKNKLKRQKIKRGRKVLMAVDADSLFFLSNSKELKKHVKIKSVGNFTGSQQAGDREIYDKCNKEKYHIFTGNHKDFFGMPKKATDSGVIGHTSPISLNVFSKIKKLISPNDNDHFYGKEYLIDEQGAKLKKDLSK